MSITFKEVEHTYSADTPFAYHALKGVNLNIKKGSMTALIGHTGSGKSTLIQHINALLLPTSGQVQIEDILITAANKPSSLKPLILCSLIILAKKRISPIFINSLG